MNNVLQGTVYKHHTRTKQFFPNVPVVLSKRAGTYASSQKNNSQTFDRAYSAEFLWSLSELVRLYLQLHRQ
jgi:hypothetical protein